MKRIQLFEQFLNEEQSPLTYEQRIFLNEVVVTGDWSRNSRGLIDVDGQVIIPYHLEIEKIPVKFGKVTGNFSCSGNDSLKTLEGSPEEVGERFSCSKCTSLVSLEGAPRKVGRNFFCYKTKITSLKGAPDKVGGDFDCEGCHSLKSLAYGPKEMEEFDYHGCSSLPKEEIEMYRNNRELFFLWMKSELSLEEFKKQKKGLIAAKNFGF